MNLFGMLEVSGSALAAERFRAEVVSANMANSETTRTPQGGRVSPAARGLPRAPRAALSSVDGAVNAQSRTRSAGGSRAGGCDAAAPAL